MRENGTQMKFDKNIPVPKSGAGRKAGERKYQFSKMEIGYSFPITDKEKQSVYSCVNNYNKTHETSIRIKTGKDSKGVLRCWRIE